MKRMLSMVALAMPLAALVAATTIPARAETDAPAKTDRTVDVFKHGGKFIVAVYRKDGSATLAIVEDPQAAKRTEKPDLAELMKTGKVTYTVSVAPEGTSLATSMPDIPRAGTTAGGPPKGKPGKTLTRRQRNDLAKRLNVTVQALDTIGKGMADGARP